MDKAKDKKEQKDAMKTENRSDMNENAQSEETVRAGADTNSSDDDQ